MVLASMCGSSALYVYPSGSWENCSGSASSVDEPPDDEFGELHPTNVFRGLTPSAVEATVAAEMPIVVRKKFLLLVVAITVSDFDL